MDKSISNKITVYMFVFTIIMVVYHTRTDFVSSNETYQMIGSLFVSIYNYLGWIGMAFFFTKTGYLLYRNASDKNVMTKLKNRVTSLLIPLTVWNTIYLCGFLIVDRERVNADGIGDVVYHYTFHPYDGPLWYVFAVFLLSLFAPLVLVIHRSKVLEVFFSLFVFGVSIAIFSFNVLSYFGLSEETHFVMWIVRLFRFIPCYALGCLIGVYKKDNLSTRSIHWIIKLCFIAIILITGIIWIINPDIHNLYKQLVIVFTPGALWLIIDENAFKSFNRRIVRNAFLIYATHFMFIFIYREIIKRLVPSSIGELGNLLIWLSGPLTCVLLTYFGCYVFDCLIRKLKLEKFEKYLTGSRS